MLQGVSPLHCYGSPAPAVTRIDEGAADSLQVMGATVVKLYEWLTQHATHIVFNGKLTRITEITPGLPPAPLSEDWFALQLADVLTKEGTYKGKRGAEREGMPIMVTHNWALKTRGMVIDKPGPVQLFAYVYTLPARSVDIVGPAHACRIKEQDLPPARADILDLSPLPEPDRNMQLLVRFSDSHVTAGWRKRHKAGTIQAVFDIGIEGRPNWTPAPGDTKGWAAWDAYPHREGALEAYIKNPQEGIYTPWRAPGTTPPPPPPSFRRLHRSEHVVGSSSGHFSKRLRDEELVGGSEGGQLGDKATGSKAEKDTHCAQPTPSYTTPTDSPEFIVALAASIGDVEPKHKAVYAKHLRNFFTLPVPDGTQQQKAQWRGKLEEMMAAVTQVSLS